MKKGGGTGPAKPWQPAVPKEKEKVPNPILIPLRRTGKDKLL